MCCSDELAAIVQDVNQFQDNLKRLKEALEALAKALEELQPVLEKLIKLGDQLADTTLKLVIEELDDTLAEIKGKSENDFILNRDAIRAIQLDIHSRTTVLKPDVFHRFRVRDVYDVAVPVGYSQDCPPLDAAFAEEINKLGVLVQ